MLFYKSALNRTFSLSDKFQSLYEYSNRFDIPHTRQLELAKVHLIRHNSVVLYGNPGEGKSTAAFRVAKTLAEEGVVALGRCVALFEPTDLKDFKSTDVDLILIDDMFGKHNSEMGKLSGWKSHFPTLQSFIETRNVKIIITSRLHIYMEYRNKLSGFSVFARTVELNTDDLSDDEKVDILKAQLNAHGRDIKDIDFLSCVSKHGSKSGFPLCCHQFAANNESYKMKSDYFWKPYKYYLEQNICDLNDQNLFGLLYVFYKHNQLPNSALDITKLDKESERILLHIAKLRGIDKSLAAIIRETKQTVNWQKGSYLRNIGKTYSFQHDTIYETVALIHGEEYPTEVIKYCTMDFFCQCIKVEGEKKEGILIIDEDDFPCLAERFIDEVLKGDNGKRLSTHQILRNVQFVEELISMISENEETLQQFLSKDMSSMYNGIHAFFYHVVLGQTSHVFHEKLLANLKCTHSMEKKQRCWKCAVRTEALAGACGANREDLYQELLDAGAQVETLCLYKACENHEINPDFVKRIYTDLKKRQCCIPDRELFQFCLGMSACHKDNRVFNILTEAGLKPSSELIYYIVKMNDSSLLSSTIKQLEDDKKWKPDAMSISRALVEAILNKQNNCLEVMKTAGALMTEFAVYWAIMDYGYDALVKVIDILKVQGTFDVESKDLAWALAIAIKQKSQDERIYRKLIDEGVIYTLPLVGALAEIGISAETIQEVIDVTKKEGRWDNEDYSVAVAYMAACKRPETALQDILEHEGANITPACLNYAVIRYADQVDFVIDTLKAKGKFDLTNTYIARAFVLSMDCQNSLGYDRLKEEGVHINMSCLPYAAERFISPQTLEKIIVGLKEEKIFNPEDDFALEALCVASKRQDNAVYKRLCSEGIAWLPRSLYVAIKSDTVYGVKHVMKHLKDQGMLDFKNKDIKEAVTLSKNMKDKRKYDLMRKYVGTNIEK